MKLRSILFKSLPSHGNRKLNSMLQAQACSRFNCIGFSVSYAFGSMIIILTHVFVCVCVVVHTLHRLMKNLLPDGAYGRGSWGSKNRADEPIGANRNRTHTAKCVCDYCLDVGIFFKWRCSTIAKAFGRQRQQPKPCHTFA